MKKILLIVVLTILCNKAYAEPSKAVLYLMDEPVSMFEWGLYKLGKSMDEMTFSSYSDLNVHDSSAKYVDDALTAHADAERRNLRAHLLKDQGTGSEIPGILGSSRPR